MANTNNPVIFTVTGMLLRLFPAENRPGCILEMGNQSAVGRYYMPISMAECRAEYRENAPATFRIAQDAIQFPDGSYQTAGTATRLWAHT